MRLTISRTRSPVKMSDSPHDRSDDNMANAATKATAPRAVFGIDASHRVSRATGGEEATTNPPTITSAICIVKLTSDQKPLPNSVASVTGFTPVATPPAKTSTIAASANTKASGNHRSQTSAMREPARARRGGRGMGDCKQIEGGARLRRSAQTRVSVPLHLEIGCCDAAIAAQEGSQGCERFLRAP